MRIGAIDIGSNSTRLLIADVDDDGIKELVRCSEVTRLGSGVDKHGKLAPDATERVFSVLREYQAILNERQCDRATAVLTSAVRDSANGEEFAQRVRSEFVSDAHILDGDEESRLTFLGATSERNLDRPTVIIDIGGGSTEFVTGEHDQVTFHTSLQTGVVRQSERHLAEHDPASPEGVAALRADVREAIAFAIPEQLRVKIDTGIAVAGTATSCAAIDQQLEPYDPTKVHGYVLTHSAVEEILTRVTPLTLPERKAIPGLHPDRALTIVAGVVILLESMDAFGLNEIEVSEHDILRGAALSAAQGSPTGN